MRRHTSPASAMFTRRLRWIGSLVLPLLMLATPVRAQDPGDSAWWSTFTAPLSYYSSTSFIGASTDAMFFAGAYTNPAASIPAPGTVLRRGADGVLRTIRGGVNHSVTAMTVTPAGDCYIAVFSDVSQNGTFVRTWWIERWNGSTWTIFPGRPNQEVRGLAVQGSTLYASGFFSAIDQVNLQYLAKWNGSTWSAVGSAVIDGPVTGVALDQSNRLFVRGGFTAIGALAVNNIARWDGGAWSALGGGTNNGGAVQALIPDGADGMYASGSFQTIGGVTAPRIARWNGTTWSALGSGIPGFNIDNGEGILAGLTRTSDGSVYAGGWSHAGGGAANSTVARWNGSTWTVIGNSIYEVLTLGNDANGRVYAGGGFHSIGDVQAYSLAVWDGSRWNAPTGGADAPVQACTTAPDGTMYIGGGFTRIAGREIRGVARWNGTEWVEVGGGVSGNIYCMTTDAQGRLYVGGYLTAAGSTAVNAIARWNGSTWDTFAGGMSSGEVRAITVASNGTVYAGGAFYSAGSTTSVNHIATWNGTAWSALGQGLTGADFSSWPPVSDLALDAQGGLYAGGGFTRAGTVNTKYVARWNGSTWAAVGGGITSTGSVYGLAVDGAGALLVGGSFTKTGNVNTRNLARWNGSVWQAFATSENGYVTNMEKDELGNVFVSGAFTTIADVPVNGIGRWSQNTWTSLGSGANYPVNDVAIDTVNHRLLAVGEFTRAGGKSSHRIGVYHLNATTPAGIAPVLTQNARAVQASAPGRTVQLTVGAADNEGPANLTYTWEMEEFAGPEPLSFSPNGTTSAATCTATCTVAGWYSFKVTARDSDGLSVTSSVVLEVVPHPLQVVVLPGTYSLLPGTSAYFTATLYDQFGDRFVGQTDFIWSASGGGQFDYASNFVAGQSVGGPHTITATTMGISGNAMVTICPAFAANINFQPALAPPMPGYAIDGGRIFAARGNGMTYGWNIDVSDTARDRNNPNTAADQRYDTLIHLQKPGKTNATWEISVPNGWYDVYVMCGDPSFYDSIFRLQVEGILAVDARPSLGNLWGYNTVRVRITDGKITVGNAPGAVNNKINFIELIAVPVAGG